MASILDLLYGGLDKAAGSSDLSSFENHLLNSDYLGQAGTALAATKFNNQFLTPNQSLGLTAGQSFLSSMLKELGANDQERQIQAVTEVLPQLYSDPINTQVPTGVDTRAFNFLKMGAEKEAVKRRIDQQEKDAALKTSVIKDLLTQRPDLAMRSLGLSDSLDQGQGGDIVSAPAPVDLLAKGLSSGGMTPAEKLIAYNKEFSKTMPRTQAAKAASEQIAAEMKLNKDSVDKAKEARDYGQKLLDLSNTADSALTAIGPTGGLLESPRELRDLLTSSLLGDAKAKERRTGRQLLESTAPEIVKMGRSPGAVSDYENRLLINSFANLGNEPEANALLVGKMQSLGQLHQDYADFLEAYKSINGGTVSGADKKWAKYRKAVPLLIGSGDNIEVNTNRPSWKEFFAGGDIQGTKSDNSSDTESREEKLARRTAEILAQLRAGR